jgi:hypothetical protein
LFCGIVTTGRSLESNAVVEDRVEGPVKTYDYVTRDGFILLNDALLSKLHTVMLDLFEDM